MLPSFANFLLTQQLFRKIAYALNFARETKYKSNKSQGDQSSYQSRFITTMDGDTPEAQKVDPDGLSKSRNLFRQRKSVLSSGKWLEIVKNSPKVSSSCEVSTSPSHFLSKVEENYEAESEKMHKRVISLSSKTLSSPSKDYSQGTLQFNLSANGSPHFVFKLENQKDIYVASLSIVKDQSVLDYSHYMIYHQRGESSSSSHLVGRIKVSTSLLNERIIEKEFVLFSSNDEHPCKKKNRGLSNKVVNVIKNNQSSISRLRCSCDEQFQEPSFENNLPTTNLETLAVVVKEEFLEEDEEEEEVGGWGLKFLKKSRLVQKNESEMESSRCLIRSVNVVIPSGIHGGPGDEPLSLIKRWKSQGKCDCGGWDLGCSLSILKGQTPEDPCDHYLELFQEGSKHEKPRLRIMNAHGGFYFVQFQSKISALQSLSIPLALIHSHKLGNLHKC